MATKGSDWRQQRVAHKVQNEMENASNLLESDISVVDSNELIPKIQLFLATEMSADNSVTEEEKAVPFTEKGKCFDEVRLIFDDNQELFVSQNFLMLSSPVFEDMFKNDFKEKQSMTVNIAGKTYADFLEFLMCIHPGTLKSIDKENVLRITPVAEKYQVESVVKRCQALMRSWLEQELQVSRNNSSYVYNRVVPARNCLRILTVAHLLNYDELTAYSASVIAKFGHRFYYGSYTPDTMSSNDLKRSLDVDGVSCVVRDIVKECSEIFNNLPAELRCTVLSERLALYQDNDTK